MKTVSHAACTLAICLLAGTSSPAQTNWIPYAFSTLAGMANIGSADGTNGAARFNRPYGATVDGNGNVYIADTYNQTIRKLTPAGTNWGVSTIAGLAGKAGSVDGTNSAAHFWNPMGLAVDSAGVLYVADSNNSTIRKIACIGSNWVVTTVAGLAGNYGAVDGTNHAARFNGPSDVAVDSHGNLYVTDIGNNTIRKLRAAGTDWVVSTIAGLGGSSGSGSTDGTNAFARFNQPSSLTVDSAGSIYVLDYRNYTIRKVTAVGSDWVVTTVAGLAGSSSLVDGTNSGARFWAPWGITAGNAGCLYVTDGQSIRRAGPAGTNWVVSTVAGNSPYYGWVDGTNTTARFSRPTGIAADSAGALYVPDASTIRKVTPAGTNWLVTTAAGFGGSAGSTDGTNSTARFSEPEGIAVEGNGTLYVADPLNRIIRKITPEGGVSTFAGRALFCNTNDGPGELARFLGPAGAALDSAGNLYVVDGGALIRQISAAGVVSTLAGAATVRGSADGTNANATFDQPHGIAVDAAGILYVGDTYNHTIRSVRRVGSDWVVRTLAGLAGSPGQADGTNSVARFNYPGGVAVDRGGKVFVADTSNGSIRKMTPVGDSWVVSTVATGLGAPMGLALNGLGNLFVADCDSTIRQLALVGTNWMTFQLAGKAQVNGSEDGVGSAARFNFPGSLAVDNLGNVYVTDTQNNTIRRGFPANAAPAVGSGCFNDGRFGFTVAGAAGQAVVVQASVDLAHWVCLQTNIIGQGVLHLSPTGSSGQGYYRVFSAF